MKISGTLMKDQVYLIEQKLAAVARHSPVGLAEIDALGQIIEINAPGENLLKPIRVATGTEPGNLFLLLDHIAPGISGKIRHLNTKEDSAPLDELLNFQLCFGGEKVQRFYHLTVTTFSDGHLLAGFDDVTEKCNRDKAIQEFVLDRALMQGKYEITSNVLHDIGNAVVGIGSYLGRIRRALEKDHSENLRKLTDFFVSQQTALTDALGEAKAGAVITMLNSITEAQQTNLEELKKSVKEQLHIITHIQEILALQRQYLSGNESQTRETTDMRSIVNDCMSMLLASIEKRGIVVALNVPTNLPVIQANRTKLMQVLLNVLKNSMEAIDITAADKRISILAHAEGEHIELRVEDNGQGFDQQTGQKLFTRGFTTKASGTGLGLSHCRTIMESHGGSMDITSEGFGKGALVTIKMKTKSAN